VRETALYIFFLNDAAASELYIWRVGMA
jgi:hypothetical protein